MCRRQRPAPPQPDRPPVPVAPAGKILTGQPPPPPRPYPGQQPVFTVMSSVYDEIGETENQKNSEYEHTNFKPDVKHFQPYQRLDEATMQWGNEV